MKIRVALALALLLAAPAAAQTTPSPKPPALAALETMVTNLGYPTTDLTDNQHFTIVWNAKYNYTMTFNVAPDNAIAYVFVDLTTFTPAQITQLPYVKMLQTDDTGDFFFSAETASAGGERVYGNTILPLGNITPTLLRHFLSDFANSLDNSAPEWDPTLWK